MRARRCMHVAADAPRLHCRRRDTAMLPATRAGVSAAFCRQRARSRRWGVLAQRSVVLHGATARSQAAGGYHKQRPVCRRNLQPQPTKSALTTVPALQRLQQRHLGVCPPGVNRTTRSRRHLSSKSCQNADIGRRFIILSGPVPPCAAATCCALSCTDAADKLFCMQHGGLRPSIQPVDYWGHHC